MPPVMLPKPTRETEITVRELSWAKDMQPTTSGPGQRQDRVGTRHAIAFDIPVKRYAWCGAGMAADLAVGRTGDGAAIVIPEPGIPRLNYGAPRANVSGQLGTNLSVKGLAPGVIIKKGKWLSVFTNGRYYAYFLTADVEVLQTGIALLPIYPMIRRSALANDLILLTDPLIQGLIKEPLQRKILRVGGIGLSFEIEEQE